MAALSSSRSSASLGGFMRERCGGGAVTAPLRGSLSSRVRDVCRSAREPWRPRAERGGSRAEEGQGTAVVGAEDWRMWLLATIRGLRHALKYGRDGELDRYVHAVKPQKTRNLQLLCLMIFILTLDAFIHRDIS